ncbi:uncharacterized protein LOC120359084 [Solenopsis invicta]|uniref:uncharacterized protein LOC120359084 n=1 Tax=Solenopsis invicta TaxID=13686 RepID=UPI00193CF982|nr:uncharacterized protein LOC120359084 [Solenopsis invicta]
MRPDIRQGELGSPSAHLSAFGWILTGAVDSGEKAAFAAHTVSVLLAQPVDELTTVLKRLWELEEVAAQRVPTPDEDQAEEHFQRTHFRDASGRYVVRLPCRPDRLKRLGESRSAALSMLLSSERRLARKPELQKRYIDFMVEYLALDHMNPVLADAPSRSVSYYLPHHAVFRAGEATGKIRVVFNASFKTTSGYSLNDCLLPGPRLQSDLWVILTRWQGFKVGFMADIVKMFRQIRVNPADMDLQRILWRADPTERVREFQLRTVTYGTTAAPFLAIRTLQQLANDEAARFPLGATALLRHSYVDDILAGGSDLSATREIQRQLVALLRAGGFSLDKWASNTRELLPRASPEEALLPAFDAVSALGIVWHLDEDALSVRVTVSQQHETTTKRTVLSDAARLFDPLGWVAPVLIFARVFMQDLWLASHDWDDPLPLELADAWRVFTASLPGLSALRVPRWLQRDPGDEVELRGFSDASERAYAAAVYARVTRRDGRVRVTLLTARAKVAPVKTQSVPRLELCGAVLVARLLRRVARELDMEDAPIVAWTDARVVLCWLRSHASRWRPFVAHRVTEVQNLVPGERWRHVPTTSNPADLATRGIPVSELLGLDLWWRGPEWLRGPPASWPAVGDLATRQEEEERRAVHLAAPGNKEDLLEERFSSLTRLRREFPGDLEALTAGGPLPTGSSLRALSPFLDKDGSLRVGGRLQSAQLPFPEKHPLILPKEGSLTELVLRNAHTATLHGGPQLMRSYLLRRFWVVGVATRVRRIARECVRCARCRAETAQQRMGQLPPERVRPSRPFASAGVDYAGPLRIRAHKGRGNISSKGYICLFVCLATRAVHLESVSDLSASAFIAAFRRFTARRGRCRLLLSDNATNFRGADAELRARFRAASEFYKEAGEVLANDGTEWRFIPPQAPHFGGLWEAGVRSVKHHLRRVIGDHALTYEETATLLCQIEACLNSRPLSPLSTDAADLVALTPGHFLVGEALGNIPEVPESDLHPTSRWRLISAIKESFWRRWHEEYLHLLQQRSKWTLERTNLTPGMMVLVRDELLPPTKWPLARVTRVFPGPDGCVRVATVRTAATELTRPITKICPLPLTTDRRPLGGLDQAT